VCGHRREVTFRRLNSASVDGGHPLEFRFYGARPKNSFREIQYYCVAFCQPPSAEERLAMAEAWEATLIDPEVVDPDVSEWIWVDRRVLLDVALVEDAVEYGAEMRSTTRSPMPSLHSMNAAPSSMW